MKIIHRYIFRELVASFAISLVALNVIMMTETLMRTAMLFTNVGASAMSMAQVVLYIQPQAAVFTTPLALMFAVLLTYGRLNATQEIAVLRTGGMSLNSLAMPVFTLASLCLVLGLLFSCWAGPRGAGKTNDLIRYVLSTRAPYSIKEGVFTSSFRDVVMFAGKKDSPDSMSDVFIYDERDPSKPRVMTASKGKLMSPNGEMLSMELNDGSMHVAQGEGSATDITFGFYRLSLPIAAEVTKTRFAVAEMTPTEMLVYMEQQKSDGDKRHMFTAMELHRRFTLPLLSLAVALFSVPLSLRAGKTGKLGGVGLGLGMIVGFYILSATLESLYKSGSLPHAAAGWLPLAVLIGLSMWLYKKEAAR